MTIFGPGSDSLVFYFFYSYFPLLSAINKVFIHFFHPINPPTAGYNNGYNNVFNFVQMFIC